MVVSGVFGGWLNYLNNFDTAENEQKTKLIKHKYIFLGIGSAFLVPAFLKMIASDLIKGSNDYDSNNYLIFTGFCLVAAIFSRRFISTIGEKILEAAKKAEKTSSENKQQIETTNLELTSTKERIEDVKLSVNLGNLKQNDSIFKEEVPSELVEQVTSFIKKTSISDYSERLKAKADIGRSMGRIILRDNLSKDELLKKYPTEGMYLALAYSVELKPDIAGLSTLNELAKVAQQLYTKYVILIGYRTLANSGIIKRDQVKSIYELITRFREKADKALARNIDDTINTLKLIDPSIVL
ncbi:hypothetical protein WSM22_35710 [Cytophagales bacterium WSM2-2]|nr:hypothetical protein WSM22_35710 [Cytophagales bacterium WSM2-2]